jgi:hypothetical protein
MNTLVRNQIFKKLENPKCLEFKTILQNNSLLKKIAVEVRKYLQLENN